MVVMVNFTILMYLMTGKRLLYLKEMMYNGDPDADITFLLNKSYKSQERLKYVTYVLMALTLALLILTAVLIYFTIHIH
jgi:hypothetical protein